MRCDRLSRCALAAIVPVLLAAAPTSAQILNTVRGWPADEPGWQGGFDASASLAGGNSKESRLAGGARIQGNLGRERVRLMLAASRKDALGEEVEERTTAHLRHNHRLADRWATLAFVQSQTNPFQRLRHRYLVGVGGEVLLMRSDDGDLSAGAAAMYEAEDIRGEPGTRETARLSAYLSGSVPIAEHASVEGTVFYQPRFSEPADYRGYAVAELVVELSSRFALTWGGEGTWDARPPEGVRKEDWELTGGFRVKL